MSSEDTTQKKCNLKVPQTGELDAINMWMGELDDLHSLMDSLLS